MLATTAAVHHGRALAFGLALTAMAALTLPAIAQKAVPTEQQLIEALQGKGSRSMGPKPGATTPAAPSIGTAAAPADSAQLKDLLQSLQAKGTRAFTAKETVESAAHRTKVAELVDKMELPKVDLEIYFDFNSNKISPRAVPTLTRLGQVMSSDTFKDRGFLLTGHTDAKGRPEPNRVVSQRRADAVKAYLIKNFKIEPSRLQSIGYGKERLKNTANPNADENRRVQIVNLPEGTLTARR